MTSEYNQRTCCVNMSMRKLLSEPWRERLPVPPPSVGPAARHVNKRSESDAILQAAPQEPISRRRMTSAANGEWIRAHAQQRRELRVIVQHRAGTRDEKRGDGKVMVQPRSPNMGVEGGVRVPGAGDGADSTPALRRMAVRNSTKQPRRYDGLLTHDPRRSAATSTTSRASHEATRKHAATQRCHETRSTPAESPRADRGGAVAAEVARTARRGHATQTSNANTNTKVSQQPDCMNRMAS